MSVSIPCAHHFQKAVRKWKSSFWKQQVQIKDMWHALADCLDAQLRQGREASQPFLCHLPHSVQLFTASNWLGK